MGFHFIDSSKSCWSRFLKTGGCCRLFSQITLILLLLVNITTPFNVYAEEKILDTVQVSDSKNESSIEIRFLVRMRYVTHAPLDKGNELSIQLQAIDPRITDLALAGNIDRESFTWQPTSTMPLKRIDLFAGDFSRPSIDIKFTQEVEFVDVRAASDLQGVIIRIRSSAAKMPEEGIKSLEQKTSPLPPISNKALPVEPAKQRDTTKTVALPTSSRLYALNLESRSIPYDIDGIAPPKTSGNYRLFTTTTQKDGKTWYRLRLGLFTNYAEAKRITAELAGRFPQAWIAKVPLSERESIAKQWKTSLPAEPIGGDLPAAPSSDISSTPAPSPRKTTPRLQETAPTLPAISPARLKKLMDEANQTFTAGDYPRAIQLYTKVTQLPENEFSQHALEYLGLSRERKGQLAHARSVYEQYLERYPDGEGADRVRQRLAGLLTARKDIPTKLRKAKAAPDEHQWSLFGGLSQFYFRDENIPQEDDEDKLVTRSMLSSDLNMEGRLQAKDYDARVRFTGGYDLDFLNDGDNGSRVSQMFLSASHHVLNLSTRLGRQSSSTGGILDRFDGGIFSYQAFPILKANIVMGFPVESTEDTNVDTDRYFYGLNFDVGTIADHWNFNIFAIQQEVDSLTDRQAVGGEIRYLDDTKSFFGLVDYDTYFASLNTALLVVNWNFPDQTNINLRYDYRSSPTLTLSNALIGQNENTIDDLRRTYSKNEIKQLAEDRSSESHLVTFGGSRRLHDKLQLTGDVTMSHISSTEESGGVEAIPSTGYEYFYNVQFVGSNLIKSGDIAIFGLRYSDTSTANTITGNLNTRYPVNTAWRINPRIRVDYRTNNSNDGSRFTLSPILRLEYRFSRRLRFEIEGGGEWMTTYDEDTDTERQDMNWYAFGGYRWDF